MSQFFAQVQMQTPMTRLLNRSGQGITPSNLLVCKNSLVQTADGWNFIYDAEDCRMVYSYKPKSGMLDDFMLSYNGGEPFGVALGGRLKLERKADAYTFVSKRLRRMATSCAFPWNMRRKARRRSMRNGRSS